MRKILLRAIALMLAILMLAFVSACSSEDTPDETNESDIAEIEQGPIDVPVLATDVEAGRRITEAMLTTKTISRDAITQTMMTSIDSVVGEFATMKLYKGDYIYKDKLSSKKPEGEADDKVISYASNSKYVDITQFVATNSGEDLYGTLQMVIDSNPQNTLYFPDGEYLISKPLMTSAIASKSVSFYLSDNAVIKAHSEWTGGGEALIKLGGAAPQNDISSLGSNYSFIGGILDGNKRAKGISIDSGRESLVRGVKIINTTVGISVPDGANNGSSDMDIEDIDIIGFGQSSIGISSVGLDNTFTDIRISNVKKGVALGSSGGSFFRGISVRLDADADPNLKYEDTVAFDTNGSGWFYSCSSENMRVGFSVNGNPIIKDFTIRWTQAKGEQIAFESERNFNAYVSNGIIDFFDATTQNSILKAGSVGRNAIMLDVIADEDLCDEQNYKAIFKISTVGVTDIGGGGTQNGGSEDEGDDEE